MYWRANQEWQWRNILLSPRFFQKSEGDIVIASVCPSVCPSTSPLCYLLLNHWTKFNQIGVWVTHMNGARNVEHFLVLHPGALRRGQKVKYHLISITKSISKMFIPNFVCLLTNERYNTYQTGFLFCRLGHAQGLILWGAGVPRG